MGGDEEGEESETRLLMKMMGMQTLINHELNGREYIETTRE
jgi:hypothetical protein